jgi:hypothetical protein
MKFPLDIMKIDLSENDVFHPGIDLEEVPCVYYFPKQEDQPMHLNINGDASSSSSVLKSPQDIMEWVIKHGRLDVDNLLLQLLNV